MVIAEQVRPCSVALAVVALVQPESMAKRLPQQVARDFLMTRFSTLAAVAAVVVVLHLQAAAVVLAETAATRSRAKKLGATVLHLAEAAAVAQERTASELARQAVTVLTA